MICTHECWVLECTWVYAHDDKITPARVKAKLRQHLEEKHYYLAGFVLDTTSDIGSLTTVGSDQGG